MKRLIFCLLLMASVPLSGYVGQFIAGAGQQDGVNTNVQITTPTSSVTYDAGTAETIDVAGTATSDRAVVQCLWTNSLGGAGVATGTNTWSIDDLPLTVGGNVITVTCTNEGGGTPNTDIITVTRSSSGDTANIWVDTNGGTCADSPTLVPYDDSTACGSLDAANDVADNGDVIVAQGGTYGAQTITGSNGRTARATISIVTGETMTVNGQLAIEGVNYLTIDGGGSLFGENSRLVTSEMGTGATPTSQYQAYIATTNEVTLQGADFGGWQLRGTTNTSVINNDIGPCNNYDYLDESSPGCTNGKITNCTINFTAGSCPAIELNADWLVQGNRIHDFGCDYSFYNGTGIEGGSSPDACHWECMYLSYIDGGTIRGNIFTNCANGGDVFTTFSNGAGEFTGGHGHRDYLVENNVFDVACSNNLGSVPMSEAQYNSASGSAGNGCGGRNGESTGFRCDIYNGGTDLTNVTFRFNTFIGGGHVGFLDASDSANDCTSSALYIYGNIMGWGSTCGAGSVSGSPSITYNLIYGAFACGTNATVVANLTGIITNNTAGSTGDATLVSGSTAAENLVPTSTLNGCSSTDIIGVTRPQDAGFCDAGAYEWDD